MQDVGRQLKPLIIHVCFTNALCVGPYIFTLYMMFRLNVQDNNDDV